MATANIMLDEGGLIVQWNARAQRLFGFPAERMAGADFAVLLDVVDGESESTGLLLSALRLGYVDYTGNCVREDGGRFPAAILLTVIRDGPEARGFSMVVQDLSEQSQVRQERRDEEARLSNIIQSAMDAIITVDEEQNIVLFNTAAERIFQCPAQQAVGEPLDRFIPERFRAVHRGHIERFSATGVTMRRMGDQTVLAGLRADGEEFPIEASISQVSVHGGRLFTVILRDITERQRAITQIEESHQQLRELYEAMHQVREAERTRIARELHDELAQWLTALKMDASWIAGQLQGADARLSEKIESMKAVVDTTVAAVRRIASDLRPAMLDDLGLVPAVEHLLHQFSARTGVVVSLEANAEGMDFGEPLATAVYRMVQEALTNVARHAQATSVEVALHLENGSLHASVRDNGKGLSGSTGTDGKSFGLMGIRERAQTLGGAARIYSPANGGTVVEVAVPVPPRSGGPAT